MMKAFLTIHTWLQREGGKNPLPDSGTGKTRKNHGKWFLQLNSIKVSKYLRQLKGQEVIVKGKELPGVGEDNCVTR